MDSLAGLNEAQRRAVEATEGRIRVVAGAGTGKTRTLTRRYGYLVEAGGVSPGHILAVTFTNKAANEMKQRVRSMVGDGDTGYICTFHALGLMILKEDLHTLGWPQNFLVLDEEDKDSLLRTVFEDMGLSASAWAILLAMAVLMLFISLAKGEGSFRAKYLNDGWKLWMIAAVLLLACLLLGAYGPGYTASDFIYGQF